MKVAVTYLHSMGLLSFWGRQRIKQEIQNLAKELDFLQELYDHLEQDSRLCVSRTISLVLQFNLLLKLKETLQKNRPKPPKMRRLLRAVCEIRIYDLEGTNR